MNYDEAKKLAELWSEDISPDQEGWRAVIGVLLRRITILEAHVNNLNEYTHKLQSENSALSLDLGIKNKDFQLPPQPQLKTLAEMTKEIEDKGWW